MNTTTHTDEQFEAMFNAGAHYGVSRSRRHPSVAKILFGQKDKVDLFDLAITETQLATACEYVRTLGRERKSLLFVGGKPESHKVVREAAARVGAPYVIGRWVGGTLTNFSEIRKRIARMTDLVTKRDGGNLTKYTKFERLQIDREIEKLESMYAGLVVMGDKLPHALFVVDPKREAIAVREAERHNIPVIALANSDCDISNIAYPISANDAAVKSIAWFVDAIADAYKEGLQDKLAPTAVAAR